MPSSPFLEPQAAALIAEMAAIGAPPLYTLPPGEARIAMASRPRADIVYPAVEIEEVAIPGGPTGSVLLRIVRPPGIAGPLPVLMYFHGGGWVLCDRFSHDRLIRDLAIGAGTAVVFVEYDRAPEAPYPIANEQAYAALEWIVGEGAGHGLDGTRIATAGDSAGGNMATVIPMMAALRDGPAICLQVLLYPVTAADFTTGSYEAFAEGPLLTRPAMQWFWDSYVPDLERRSEPTASPLLAPVELLAQLPPALVITVENDVLRDEGEAYARRLIEAGVSVTAVRYLATIHDFIRLDLLVSSAPSLAAIAQITGRLRAVFAKV